MATRKTVGIVALCALLGCGATAVHAAADPHACEARSPKHAHALAEQAKRDGAHRRAAECYRLAGEPLESDRALAKAFAQTNAASSRQASAAIGDAKSQARRLREAFRGRPTARMR